LRKHSAAYNDQITDDMAGGNEQITVASQKPESPATSDLFDADLGNSLKISRRAINQFAKSSDLFDVDLIEFFEAFQRHLKFEKNCHDCE
jgi:hypothetical protein